MDYLRLSDLSKINLKIKSVRHYKVFFFFLGAASWHSQSIFIVNHDGTKENNKKKRKK